MVSLRNTVSTLACDPGSVSPLARWREGMQQAFPLLRIVPIAGGEFRGGFRSAGSSELQISDIVGSAQVVERRPAAVTERDLDFYKISIQISGTGTMTQASREIPLTRGTIAMYDTSKAYTLQFDGDYHFVVAMFPKNALDLPSGLASELTALPIADGAGVGSLLSTFMLSLAGNLELLTGPSGGRLARTGLDLVSTLAAAQFDGVSTSASAERSALMARICRHVNTYLREDHLSPRTIAAEHFISLRQLHSLFQPTGVGVSQWIKRRRLQESRRDLCDPVLAERTINSIGASWGFHDPGYFSRSFKEVYGMTPGNWRAASKS